MQIKNILDVKKVQGQSEAAVQVAIYDSIKFGPRILAS